VEIHGGQLNSTSGHHITINVNRELATITPALSFIHFCFQKAAQEDLLARNQAEYEPFIESLCQTQHQYS